MAKCSRLKRGKGLIAEKVDRRNDERLGSVEKRPQIASKLHLFLNLRPKNSILGKLKNKPKNHKEQIEKRSFTSCVFQTEDFQ